MNNTNINIFLFNIVFIFLSFQLSAQGDLPSEQVEVIKDFDARIERAQIVNLQAIIPARDTTQKIINAYNLSPSSISISYDPPRIKPLSIPQEKQPDYYPLFLKAGYGTPNSPYAQASYHWFNQENIDLHVHGLYHAANKKNLEHQKFREINGGFTTRYISNFGTAIKGGINYRSDNHYLYGYDHETFSFSDSLASRPITQLGLDFGISNAFKTEADVNYNANIRYNNLDDAKGYKESEIELLAGIHKRMSSTFGFGLDVMGLVISPKDTMIENLTNYQIKPSVDAQFNKIKVRAGINAAKNEKIKIYPNIYVEANVAPGRLIAFLGWDGGLKSNSFSSLYDVNPYISPLRSTLTSTEYHEIYGGAKGSYKMLNFEAKLGYEIIEHLPIYLRNISDSRYLDAIYADGKIFRLSAKVNANISKGIEVHAGVLSNTYNLDDHEKAWHLPAFNFSIGATTKFMQDKLRTTINFTSENGVPVLNADNIQDRLKPLLDLSIGADYMVTKNIGAFIQLNNLFNNQRERWIQYPNYGINFKGGVIVRL